MGEEQKVMAFSSAEKNDLRTHNFIRTRRFAFPKDSRGAGVEDGSDGLGGRAKARGGGVCKSRSSWKVI
jgi:hypothetical protein